MRVRAPGGNTPHRVVNITCDRAKQRGDDGTSRRTAQLRTHDGMPVRAVRPTPAFHEPKCQYLEGYAYS